MQKIQILLEEVDFDIYQAICRVHHKEDVKVQDVGEILRGMPGVLTVVQVEHNPDNNTAVMKIKIITKKSAKEGYASFVKTTLERVNIVTKIEVAEKTIEKKN